MKKKILLLSSALMLASCGGSTSASTATSGPSSGLSTSETSSPEASSSSEPSASEPAPSYSQRTYEDTEWTLKANKPSKAIAKDFAFGVDVSSLKEVEEGGGVFYGEDGKKADCYQILADGGANYARIRLWNDPYDGNGTRYGGGTNDIQTDIELAKRAQAAGLQILIDFHYSDSWVDPGKFWAPKAWKGMTYEEKAVELGKFTKESLQAFKDAGVTVHAIQIGNEINPGIAGIKSSNYQRIAGFFTEAIEAAHSVFPYCKTIAHYTNVNNPAIIFTWLGYLEKYNAMPDIVGVSYYPFWHGGLDNLQYVLDKIATDFKVDVMVMETSWGFTDDEAPFCNNQFNSETLGKAGGYATSPQAQVTVVADIVDVLSKVPDGHGKGIFYWEPAWLPNQNSGWITQEGAYYNDKGVDWVGKITKEQLDELYDPDYYGWSSWANQAWFDYEGHALPSVSTYRHIIVGDHQAEEVYESLLKSEADMILNISEEWAMPETIPAVTNLGAYRQVTVEWNAAEVAAITNPGYYTVHGTAEGFEYVAHITAEKNFIKDPGFERQGCTTESPIVAPWQVETTTKYKDFGDVHIEAKAELGEKGNQYLHWYSNDDIKFSVFQELGTVPAGSYNFGFTMLSSYYDAGGTDGKVTSGSLWLSINGERFPLDIREEFAGYGVGAHLVAAPMVTLAADAEIVIGFDMEGTKGVWGHADDFYFSAVLV